MRTAPDYDALNRELDAKFEANVVSIGAGIDRLKSDNADLIAALEAMIVWANSNGASGGYPGTQAKAALLKAKRS